MATQITNNTTTLDIDYAGNGDQYSIYKTNITLEKSGDYVVIVDSGRVPAKEYKVLHSDVTVPANTDADDLYSILLGYINTYQEDIISKLASLDSKTYNINPRIDESPQELLRQIHSGIDILTEQQMLTNNLLKLILS